MKQGFLPRLFVAVVVFAGCAHVNVPVPGMPGIGASVLPIYVHATGQETEREFRGRKTTTSRYYACNAVYVRPNVLVTSINAFPGELFGNSVQYLGDIFVGADGERRTVKAYHTHGLIALVVTEESGTPLPLRRGQAANGERLTKPGLGFTEAPARAAHSLAEMHATSAVIIDSPFAAFAGEDLPAVYRASTDFRPGQCGAPLVDGSGRLVGIVSLGSATTGEVSVVNAAMIAEALREFGL